ncbi:MAG: hypothetical protein KAR45_13410, partial [Desulfobacteraceae bacterium]|nr:hypothetical protein [Desulfobacteraceae bacterium]
NRNIKILDTTHLDHNEVNYQVTKEILNKLHELTAQKIGYFDSKSINSNGPFFRLSQTNIKDLDLMFGKRDIIEADDKYVQPIPIAVVTDKKMKRILVARKKNVRTSKQSPEKKKNLIYFGGHVREEDKLCIEDKKTFSSIKQALFREIKEELGIDFHPKEIDPICFWIKSHPISRRHLAICFVIKKDINFINFTIDKHEFTTQGKNRSGKIMPIETIVQNQNRFEEWSKAILSEIFDQQIEKQLNLFPNS